MDFKKIRCPIPGCNKDITSKEQLINHCKEKHKDMETLRIGKEVIDIKGDSDETKTKN